MKMTTVLYLLINALVVVNGLYFDVSDEHLKKITQNVLNKTEIIKNDIESTLADIKTINASIPEFIKNIPSMVSKHQAILDVQKTVENTKSKKKKIAKCQKVFEEKIEDLNAVLQKNISKVLREQFEEAENQLHNMKEDLLAIVDSIKNNLANEIKACNENGYKCMITEANLEDENKYIAFVVEVKASVAVLMDSVTIALNDFIIPARSEKIVFEPVTECLKKISCK